MWKLLVLDSEDVINTINLITLNNIAKIINTYNCSNF